MIIEFLKNGKLNKKLVLAENYKKLGLTENQYVIISLVLELDKIGQKVSTPPQLANYMNLTVQEIEHELNHLVTKGFLIIDVKSKKHNLDFTPLYNKLAMIFQINLIREMSREDPVQFVSQYFDTTLTNNEKNHLKEILQYKNAPTLILDLLISKNFKNVQDFIAHVSSLTLENDEIKIMEYDWLRNH